MIGVVAPDGGPAIRNGTLLPRGLEGVDRGDAEELEQPPHCPGLVSCGGGNEGVLAKVAQGELLGAVVLGDQLRVRSLAG